MNPRSVFSEFFQEHCCRNGASPSSAGVHDVGDTRADLLLIFIVEGQTPHLLASFYVGVVETIVHFVIVGKNSGITETKRDDDCSGERRGIDQMRAAQLFRIVQPVGEHEPCPRRLY